MPFLSPAVEPRLMPPVATLTCEPRLNVPLPSVARPTVSDLGLPVAPTCATEAALHVSDTSGRGLVSRGGIRAVPLTAFECTTGLFAPDCAAARPWMFALLRDVTPSR